MMARMAPADAPVIELGTAGAIIPAYYRGASGARSESYVVDPVEDVPELKFPLSAAVYDRMRKSDGQHAAVMRAIRYPILRTDWQLTGDDVAPDVMAFVASELGLTGRKGRARRRRQGVSWLEHVREVLLMLPFGFMPFEQVYEVAPPSPDQADAMTARGLDEVAHLRKLAPRMPRTVQRVAVARDGGLEGIVQLVEGAKPDPARGTGYGEQFIPTDQLVMYVNDREGAEWTGQSLFRSSYGSWIIKTTLVKLGAMIVERNGMGLPVVRYKAGSADRARALRLAQSMRAGATAGVAAPDDMTIELLGVTGSTYDPLPQIKYHDEAAGRAALAMLLNLGHDNGARALGQTFQDFFAASLDGIADYIAETATEHIIRDLVAINFGEDEPYPILEPAPILGEQSATAEALKSLADAGLLGSIDAPLVSHVRKLHGLPDDTGVAINVPPAPGTPATDGVEETLDPGAAGDSDVSEGSVDAELVARVERLAQLTARLANRTAA
jgi:hypothetical protein